MRSRKEIEDECVSRIKMTSSLEGMTHVFLSTQLEVLLDMREILLSQEEKKSN